MAAEESQALIRFTAGWAADGVSEDGMPRYRETIRITKSIPPYTEVEYEATEQDFSDYPGPFEVFQRTQQAIKIEPGQAGFPLALWPVISPAMFKMLTAREVFTVEQLAKLSTRSDMPGDFKELAERAKQMIALSANVGQYEAMIRDLNGQIDALKEQAAELRATVSAQNSKIAALQKAA